MPDTSHGEGWCWNTKRRTSPLNSPDCFTFFQAPHTHILCYLIPGPDGSLQPGSVG